MYRAGLFVGLREISLASAGFRLRQRGSRLRLNQGDVGAVDRPVDGNVFAKVTRPDRLTGLRLRLRDVAGVHRSVCCCVAKQHAHRRGQTWCVAANGVSDAHQRDFQALRVCDAGEINDVLMRVGARRPTRDGTGARHGRIGNANDRIGKDKNDGEIAILATGAAFNADWAGRRQADIECTGTAMDFSGNSTKKRNVSRATGVTHQSVTAVTGDVIGIVLGFLSRIRSGQVCPDV
jgi:hypothetical protein